MNEIKRKLNLIEEAVDDYKKGKLSDVSTLIAISIITNRNPSKECTEWAKKVFTNKEFYNALI
jgi:hypothetical protein